MRYTVYHIESANVEGTYQSERVAKGRVTKLNKRDANAYAYALEQVYNETVNVWVETYNMLDPQRRPIKIRKADLGGCCDPATERYHTM